MILYVYIDVFFVINFIMDFTLLKLLEKMRKKKISLIRNVLAGAVGSFGVCFLFLFSGEAKRWMSLLGMWILCELMIFLVFGKQSLCLNIYNTLILFLLSFLFGGFLHFLYYEVGFKVFLEGKSSVITILFFFLLFSCSYLVIGMTIDIIRQQEKIISYQVPVIIERGGKKVEMQGYIDTGNHLYEPISHKPVILVEFESVKLLFLPEEIKLIRSYLEEQGEFGEETKLSQMKFHLIPYQCAAGNTGCFIGVLYDRIYIGDKKEKREKGYMALQKEKLSLNGEYEVLLHTELV